MDLYPAIDLRGGAVVRLAQGDYERETSYDADPIGVARAYAAEGAPWIHTVDLDAARQKGSNRSVIEALAAVVDVPVQAGGGVRTVEDAESLYSAGVQRVVVGTAAFREERFVADLAASWPGRVAVDVAAGADGNVNVQGWTEVVAEDALASLKRFRDLGVAAFVVTSVVADGTLVGPDLRLVEAAVGVAGEVPVLASGGVGSLEDLRRLKGTGCSGVVVGRALFEGRFSVSEAVAACG